MQNEFTYILDYVNGKGVDVGCGTNRLSPDVLAIDNQPNREYAHCDVVHDCKDLDIEPMEWKGKLYRFDGDLDFIFSSHCLEDFPDIRPVFVNWWSKLKVGGKMVLLLPDMEQCDCDMCKNDTGREREGRTARYWTIEDMANNGRGNPSHRTNVGKKFIGNLLNDLKNDDIIEYNILQQDTIPHNVSCTVDIVIEKRR